MSKEDIQFEIGDKVRMNEFKAYLEIEQHGSYIINTIEDDGLTIKLKGLKHWYRTEWFSLITAKGDIK